MSRTAPPPEPSATSRLLDYLHFVSHVHPTADTARWPVGKVTATLLVAAVAVAVYAVGRKVPSHVNSHAPQSIAMAVPCHPDRPCIVQRGDSLRHCVLGRRYAGRA